MPAPNSPAASSGNFADSLQARLSPLMDLGLLLAAVLAGGIFYGVLVSPPLVNVRRTYLELGTGGQLLCATLFVGGLILLLLSLFWVALNIIVAVLTRPGRLARRSRAAVEAGFEQARQDAGALFAHMLAEMRREGATEQEIAQARALVELVSRKVEADSERRLAEYRKNPAILENEIRGAVERLERGEIVDGGFKRP